MNRQTNLKILCLSGCIGLAAFTSAHAQAPFWWYSRGVLNTNLCPKDYALVTQGQLKAIAKNAFLELDSMGGANSNLAAMINGLSTSNNLLLANIGQVKALAAPFYDQLYALDATNNEIDSCHVLPAGMTHPYPWTGRPGTNDYAVANIGQVKYAFSFDLNAMVVGLDSDHDGMPDWWELANGLNPNDPSDAARDPDGDGLTNLQEYRYRTNPHLRSTAGDGFTDAEKIRMKLNPSDPAVGQALTKNARATIVESWNAMFKEPLVFTNIPGSPEDLRDMGQAMQRLSGTYSEAK